MLDHPVVIVHLSLLFNILFKHNMVRLAPDDFGHGIVILLLWNRGGNKFLSDNYTGITLSPVTPVISKLFVMMRIYEKQLDFDPLQLGFKQNSSCQHALFSLKTVVDHYLKHISIVNICFVLWIFPKLSTWLQ